MQLYLLQLKFNQHLERRSLDHLSYIFPALALLLFPPELCFFLENQNKHSRGVIANMNEY